METQEREGGVSTVIMCALVGYMRGCFAIQREVDRDAACRCWGKTANEPAWVARLHRGI